MTLKIENLESKFENMPYHANLSFTKVEMPSLPSCFEPTTLGSYKAGMLAQYRRGLFHVYEFPTYWLIHKDRYNPETHPLEHLVEDARNKFFFGLIALGFVVQEVLKRRSKAY